MFKFFHRMWNPHCSHCAEERLNDKICESCEILKMQLSLVQQEKKELLSLIVDKHKPETESAIREIPQPIKSKHTPWAVKRQILESESREAARILAQRKIDELENQILGDKGNASESEAESELKSDAV
jgi:hypothetical protein